MYTVLAPVPRDGDVTARLTSRFYACLDSSFSVILANAFRPFLIGAHFFRRNFCLISLISDRGKREVGSMAALECFVLDLFDFLFTVH